MNTRLARRGGLGILAVGIGASLALAGSATVAVSEESTSLQIQSSAVLVARGAAVSVPMEVVCQPDYWARSVNLEVWQRVGSGTAHGSGTASVICEGTPQVVNVVIPADGPKAFKVGPAYVEADMYANGTFTDQATVAITQK